jgi:type IV pilus assembly protein PilY1
LPGQDGIPDNYFLVTNPLGLEAALDRAFITILSNASASSVATNSTSLQTGSTIYQARFNSNDWSGQVLAYPSVERAVSPSATWDAGQVINGQNFDSGRVVLTYNTTRRCATGCLPLAGEPRQPRVDRNPAGAGEMPSIPRPRPASADGRGQQRLNYLRGDPSQEGATVTSFRQRPTASSATSSTPIPTYVARAERGNRGRATRSFA